MKYLAALLDEVTGTAVIMRWRFRLRTITETIGFGHPGEWVHAMEANSTIQQ